MTSIKRHTLHGLLVALLALCVPAGALASPAPTTSAAGTTAAVRTVREFAADQLRYQFKKACGLLTPAYRKLEIKRGRSGKVTVPCALADYTNADDIALGVVWDGVTNKPFGRDLDLIMDNHAAQTLPSGDVQVTVNNGNPIVTLTLTPQSDGSYRISHASQSWLKLTGSAASQQQLLQRVTKRLNGYYAKTLPQPPKGTGVSGGSAFAYKADLLTGGKLLSVAEKLFPKLSFSSAQEPASGAKPGLIYLGNSTIARTDLVAYDTGGDRFETAIFLSRISSKPRFSLVYPFLPAEVWLAGGKL